MNGVFGVGPLELVVIAVLALVVIGPERLPGVIAQTMRVIRELRGYATQMQDELKGEFDSLRGEFDEVAREFNEFGAEVTASAAEITNETQQVVNQLPTAADLTAPPPPRDPITDLTTPLDVRTNGVSHVDEEERPSFSDYRPS